MRRLALLAVLLLLLAGSAYAEWQAATWEKIDGTLSVGTSAPGQVLYNKSGAVAGAPMSVDGDGNITGIYIPRQETEVNIRSTVLGDGEIASTSDTLSLFLGDGSSAGGTQFFPALGSYWTGYYTGLSHGYFDIAYGNGIFVAIAPVGGYSDRVAVSYDGLTWASTSCLDTFTDYTSIAFGNGVFVVAGSNGKVAVSPDGLNWKKYTLNDTSKRASVTFGKGKFVAAIASDTGTDASAISYDGVNWTYNNAVIGQWVHIAYGNGLFVALSGSSGTGPIAMTYPDGVSWTSRDRPQGFDDVNPKKIVYGNGRFVAVGTASAAHAHLSVTSTTGAVWLLGNLSSSSATGYSRLGYGAGRFFASTGSGVANSQRAGGVCDRDAGESAEQWW
jgi:hypothetical protein